MGRLVVMQRHKGMASNYDCQYCLCPDSYDSLSVSPSTYPFLPVDTHPYASRATYKDCNGSYTYYDRTSGSTWSSNNTPVATVNDSAPKGLVTAVAGGSASIGATYVGIIYVPTCQPPPCHVPCTCYYPVHTGGGTANVMPNITSISPLRGLIGATTGVTISGSGFGASRGTSTVNAESNMTFTYNSWSDTQIQVDFQVASNAPSGNHNVTVTTTQGTSNSDKVFYVQVPTSLSVLTVSVLPDGPDPPSGCPASANYGIQIDIKYLVRDQSNPPNPIQSASMTPHETGTLFSGTPYDNNIGPIPGYPTSTEKTASDGTFHDVPVGVCRNLPISNPGLTSTQNITVITPATATYQVRTQSFTVTAPGSESFGHGSITNGSDISASR